MRPDPISSPWAEFDLYSIHPAQRKSSIRNPSFIFPAVKKYNMQEKQERTQKIVFLENDDIEEEDEEIDIVEEPDQQYDVNFWRKEDDVPT